MAEEQQNPQRPFGGEESNYRPYWLWIAVILMMWGLVALLFSPAQREDIAYSEFKQALREERVTEVHFEGEAITGTLLRPVAVDDGPADQESVLFSAVKPPYEDPELAQLLEAGGVTVTAETTEPAWWATLITGLLPWLIILAVLIWAFRRMQERMGGIGGKDSMFGFGKSKARRFRKGSTGITFDDVAGLENAKLDLREIVEYLKDPNRYQALGAKVPRGILLMGPPGTGKTLLAKAVAGEADVPFYSISGSEFIEMFVGVGAARVRDMFQSAKQESPSIIFIDELDSVGRARGTGLGGGHDEREQTLNQILNEMDGFAPHETVVVLAATNRPDVLDKALLRPGRFDRKVTLELPLREARVQVLSVHTRKVPLDETVRLEKVAARTVGFSGADLENLVNEAALLAGREGRQTVGMIHFERARDKIILGAERQNILSETERERVAFHEAGHAVMAWLLSEADPLDKVTIIPRGHALGATEQLPQEERQNLRTGYLRDRLGVMLGGRVAEQLVYNEVSTGAESDLKQATAIARRMVTQWGMSERLGPVAYRDGEEHVFLGREMTQPREFSEQTAQVIDQEVYNILTETERRAHEILSANRDKLNRLAARLQEQETVEAAALERLFAEEV